MFLLRRKTWESEAGAGDHVSMSRVLLMGHPALRTPCLPRASQGSTREAADALLDAMSRHSREKPDTLPIGLSAPQIGRTERVFLFARLNETLTSRARGGSGSGVDSAHLILHTSGARTAFEAAAEPQVLSMSDEMSVEWEECLSVPGLTALVPRPESIEVAYTRADGSETQERLTGIEARVFQHELDHLDGVLYTDRAADSGFEPFFCNELERQRILVDEEIRAYERDQGLGPAVSTEVEGARLKELLQQEDKAWMLDGPDAVSPIVLLEHGFDVGDDALFNK